MQRKLTAILSADVKGYSRLMGEDEVATVQTLTAYREVMASVIQRHRGRVVDSPGDNLLAEFASVVDAVQCAVDIQRELKARNAELPDHRKMEFRIGINLGDVIVEGERIYGRNQEAQAQAAEVLRLNPKFSLEPWAKALPVKDPAVLERRIAAMRKAGLKNGLLGEGG